jgi:protein ImuB
MTAIACVDVPVLPLQLVWRAMPAWRQHPVVVVDEDRPQGTVLWACERARRSQVLPGMRYAHALSLAAGLYATVVPPERIAAVVDEIAAALRRLSPSVEPAAGQPGTFWLDGAGLARLFPEPDGGEVATGTRWAQAIVRAVDQLGLRSTVVAGFTRFGTYAVARAAARRLTVFGSDEEERTQARSVPLARLDIAAGLRDALARLAVTTVGQLVRLPGGGILERFGSEAHRLYQLAAGERWDPLVPEPPPEAPDETVLLDDAETDVARLLFSVKSATDRLLARLATRRRALVTLHLELTLQHGIRGTAIRTERIAHAIRPAAPTLDGRSLLRLVHLRLDGQPPAAGVIAVRVWADDVGATREQLALFAQKPRRDLRAASEAVASLRAELGDDAVMKAVLRDGHLPEARYGWERLLEVAAPAATPRDVRPVPRRVKVRPVLLPPQSPNVRDDGWLLSGLEHGAVVRIQGPYVVSGGWWASEIHREYHFAETRRGDLLWVYYDRARRRWYQHGAVE